MNIILYRGGVRCQVVAAQEPGRQLRLQPVSPPPMLWPGNEKLGANIIIPRHNLHIYNKFDFGWLQL